MSGDGFATIVEMRLGCFGGGGRKDSEQKTQDQAEWRHGGAGGTLNV
jgi:hypothetical protein